jgi:hypothetical protein
VILEALAEKLQDDGVGTVGTNIFIGLMPSTPDVCIALYEYSGEPPRETFNDGGASIDVPSVQVMVRAGRNDYPTARAKIIAVRNSLSSVANVTVEGVVFLRVHELSAVNALGVDENDRPRFTQSFQALVER